MTQKWSVEQIAWALGTLPDPTPVLSTLPCPVPLPSLRDIQIVLLGAQRRYARWLKAEKKKATRRPADWEGKIVREVLLAPTTERELTPNVDKRGVSVVFHHCSAGTYCRIVAYLAEYRPRSGEIPESGTLEKKPVKKVLSNFAIGPTTAPAMALAKYSTQAEAIYQIGSHSIFSADLGKDRLTTAAMEVKNKLQADLDAKRGSEVLLPQELIPQTYGLVALLHSDETEARISRYFKEEYFRLRLVIYSSQHGWAVLGSLFSPYTSGEKAETVPSQILYYAFAYDGTPLADIRERSDDYGQPRSMKTEFKNRMEFFDRTSMVRRMTQVNFHLNVQWMERQVSLAKARERQKLLEAETRDITMARQLNEGVFELLVKSLCSAADRVGQKSYLKTVEVYSTGVSITHRRGANLEVWRFENGVWAYRTSSFNRNTGRYVVHEEGVIHGGPEIGVNDIPDDWFEHAVSGRAEASAMYDPTDSVKMLYKQVLDAVPNQRSELLGRVEQDLFPSHPEKKEPPPAKVDHHSEDIIIRMDDLIKSLG